jgi:hypothetical protein
MYAMTRNQLEATIMNPTVMSMMVKAKQDDILREAEAHRVYSDWRPAGHSISNKVRLGLFASAVLALLIVLVVMFI